MPRLFFFAGGMSLKDAMNTEHTFDYCHFLREAYKEYALYVKTGKKTYHRFHVDFLNGHKSPLPCEDRNEHERIMGSLKELLFDRKPLVEHFFKKACFTEEDCRELLRAHNTTNTGEHPVEKEDNIKKCLAKKQRAGKRVTEHSFSSHMNETQLDRLADLLCGRGAEDPLAPYIEDTDWKGTDVKMFLQGEKQMHIAKRKNLYVLMMLDEAAYAKFISPHWLSFFEQKKSLMPYGSEKALTRNQMCRSLSGGKKAHRGLTTAYREMMNAIAGLKEKSL